MPRLHLAPTFGLAVLALGACAADGAAEAVPAGPLRIVVQLAGPVADPAAVAAAVSASSGLDARYLAAVSADSHVLSLACRDAADCGAALERLRNDRRQFAAVRIDGRKRAISPES